jgi:hypothetical protein
MSRGHTGTEETPGSGGWLSRFADQLVTVIEDLRGLRRTARRQRADQERYFTDLTDRLDAIAGVREPSPPATPPAVELDPAQLEALCRLDEAVTRLLALEDEIAATELRGGSQPASTRESLAMLEVRCRNLQRSFGVEPVAAAGLPFDDRVHQVHTAVDRADRPQDEVIEEVRPGYLYRGRLVRPALVVVNRRDGNRRDDHDRRNGGAGSE